MSNPESRASHDQARASDPDASAWVSANAGSGKTHVLVNRVIRLMLTGTPPEKILCLTYTRAAAAEMSNRLYERLAEWIPLDDEALIEKIFHNTGHTRFKTDELAAPRRLFARALETPGGLKIQTIHAFCEQLLHRFPLEAGVTSGFTVMDDRQARELLVNTRADFFSSLDQDGGGQIHDSLIEVVKFSSGQKGFDDLLAKLLGDRDKLAVVYQDLDAASDRLADALGIDRNETIESIMSLASEGLDRPGLVHAREVLEKRDASTDQKQAALLQQILGSDSNQLIFEGLKSLTLIAGDKRKSDKTLCTPKCGEENPAVLQTLQIQADHIEVLVDRVKAIDVLHATDAALRIGQVITARYEAEKARLGFYDYRDLISKVLAMFAVMPDAAWVLYKLDGGLDHILIDEAQDTSPAQWDIVQFLADDFFTGAGARSEVNRSIFAVGDRKQSIYSFQGAVPESFDLRKRYFQRIVEQSGQRFEPVDFEVSFRSTKDVLALVDQIFEQPEAAKGVDNTIHSAQRGSETGIVELWPLEEKPVAEKRSVWMPDTGEATDSSAQIRLARKIALKIRSWLDSHEILQSENRPIRPDDILILVQRRTQFMAALVRALKQADVPIAGVDRLKLTRHIAVQDLMALARFVLLPQDDLNFAGLLKSSLLAKNDGTPFDDEDLISLAARRRESSVWSAFMRPASDDVYTDAKDDLVKWQKRARMMLPFDFFSCVLSADNKRKEILKRLGSEATEPLDAFLLLTQEYEKNNVATLQGFLSWVESGDTEIKREMEKNASEVRIMTVHGAKGLESKIVILPDTFDVLDGKNIPKLLEVDEVTPVWRLKAALETRMTGGLKKQYLDESSAELNRLLYVALTRACDRLYIAAAEPKKGQMKPNSWYRLAKNILDRPDYLKSDPIFGNVWRFSDDVTENEEPDEIQTIAKQPAPLPAWVFKIPTTGNNLPPAWIAPSRLGLNDAESNEAILSPLAGLSENRFQRGNLIHKMLQYLPEVAPEKQNQIAESYIANHGGTLSDLERQSTLTEILQILTDERFTGVFAPGSMAEVPIVARINAPSGEALILNGQIDRLCISDDQIFIVDYKTNRPPPASVSAVNRLYIRQLAAYRLALLEMYPDHAVRAGLLWTHNAVLMEIEEKLLANVFLN